MPGDVFLQSDAVAGLLEWSSVDADQQKGEIVLLVKGGDVSEGEENDVASNAEAQRILKILLQDLPLSQASALAAKITGGKKKPLYQFGLTLGGKIE